ncbi:uncharacterized protein LOC132721401 [Ruditapes philippinarum]|uniref:uncharacterized protein LOC132721401 n=1 Tax=Ruditapes philippinarum TaxID=129788 RepID=UPI00295B5BA9|nr:uncharacterized protein LOC132721401 [Ruditapes philippinarum]
MHHFLCVIMYGMTMGSVTIALNIFFLSTFARPVQTAGGKGLHYGVIANIIPDGSANKSKITTRGTLSCAQACFTKSMEGSCTIASYNKNTKECTLSTSTVRDLMHNEDYDEVTLFPQSGCDVKDLPTVDNGVYEKTPFMPGFYSIRCAEGYDISLASKLNSFICDVTKTWIYNNVTCIPEAELKFTEGRSFVATFMGNYEIPNKTFHLYIVTSDYDVNSTFQYSTVTVNIPNTSFQKTYTIAKYLEIELSNVNISDAIYISTTDPVTVFTMNKNQYSTGGMLVFPLISLGKTYVIATTPYDDLESSLVIIPIDIEAKFTLSFPDNTTENVYITYGKSYELKRSGLSGTYIESDEPIAVFAGEKCANLPDAGNYSCDHIIEQMPPLDALDHEYIIAPTKPRSYFGLLVVATSQDTTHVSINSETDTPIYTSYLKRHDTFYQTFDNAQHLSVKATEPVLVVQYGVSISVDNMSQGDASMFVVPGINHFTSKYRFVVPDGYNTNKVILIYNITNGNDPRAGLKLNGNATYLAEMTSIKLNALEDYGVCYLDIEAGVHELENTETFGAVLYGQGRYIEYAWNLGMYMWK